MIEELEVIRVKLDAIKAKIDLDKTKALSFLAIAGGSWFYIFKENIPVIVKVGAVIIFVLSNYGIILNFVRFSKLHTKIEELENDIR
jgi:hypothetical protein